MNKIKGKPASSGIATGKVLLYNSKNTIVLKEEITEQQAEVEIRRLNNAIRKTKAQLKKIQKDLHLSMGKDSALIIETQSALVNEGNLVNDIRALVRTKLVKVEWAVKEVEKKYLDIFNNLQDLSFREKGNDISDVLGRILNNLKKGTASIESHTVDDVIIVADYLPPSVAANVMGKGRIKGLVFKEGGETSHSVILARTLDIPTILNVGDAADVIKNDDFLIVDGLSGDVYINPQASVVKQYVIKQERYQLYKQRLEDIIKLEDKTADGHPFKLLANIELPFESDTVLGRGARGVGLYRTEFLFTDPAIALSEQEQYLIYKNISGKVYPHPLVIRTYDVGRDKDYGYFPVTANEENPALGTMAVRLFLKEKDVLKTQLRAIIKANEAGNIKILFPMITEMEEIFTLRYLIEELKEELRKEGEYPGKDVEFGIMLEIPGTIKLIKYMGDIVDFFSVGTNDLMQYLLAVERDNTNVSYLFNPFQPAVIQVLDEIIKEVKKIGKPVNVCGEIAGKPFTALMLMGLGYDSFSMNPTAVAELKRVFTQIHYSFIKKTVKQLKKFRSRVEAEEYMIETLLKKYPGLFIKQPVI